MSEILPIYKNAVDAIRTAILESQQMAVQQVANVQLALYYGVGRYLSVNTRQGTWGTGAIDSISEQLQKQMPGLRGFSAQHMRSMRLFYEEWSSVLEITISKTNEEDLADKLKSKSRQKCSPMASDNADIAKNEISSTMLQFCSPSASKLQMSEFMSISFSHHMEILRKTQTYEERIFYIHQTVANRWSKYTLRKFLTEDLFHHQSLLPNNFIQTMPSHKQALKAITMFKDEYLLDYINTEELGVRDEDDIDERVLEQGIVHNIKNFIMTFGQDFSFMGNQYRVVAGGKELFIDLLFYNRELQSLVAVELKAGEFKAAYLGQLHIYLQALDDYVRKPYENPSIGIILCKSADRTFVEYAVRDYDKPMGVATYLTSADMPERIRKALPAIDQLQQLL